MFHLINFQVTTFLTLLSSLSLWKTISCCGAPERQQTIGDWLNKTSIQYEAVLSEILDLLFESAINITDENSEKVTAKETNLEEFGLKIANEAFDLLNRSKELPECNITCKRMLHLFSISAYLISRDEKKRKRESELILSMGNHYSTSSVEKENKTYRLQPEFTDIMSKSRNPEELLWALKEWHNLAAESRDNFTEMIKLTNEAAAEHGFGDAGMVWRLKEVENSSADVNMKKIMEELDPLYKNLHAYVREKLREQKQYEKIIDPKGAIPAHLLGDMWAQEWSALEDLLLPYPDAPPDDPNIEMDCHAAAYDMLAKDDYRIKMCAEINDIDFEIIHHEMGHIVYFMEYSKQPFAFRDGAIPSFHEAVGDIIALSVMSQKHLEKIGLIDKTKPALKNDTYKIKINSLMRKALDKIVFLSFALSLELWRYGVFSGSITPDEYNNQWWEIRKKYQGIKPPVERGSEKFDPGAKYHVVANVPYGGCGYDFEIFEINKDVKLLYFYSFIAQFQFHEALCKLANYRKDLYNCDIYRNKAAGEKFGSMLAEGASRPWQELMKDLTGSEEFSVKPLLNYFKPLRDWLLKKNKELNITIGWEN